MLSKTGSWYITNVNIITEDGLINGNLRVQDGKIISIAQPGVSESVSDVPVIDGQGGWMLPGFIDVHVHGGFGADFMDANEEAYDRITQFHARNGTTSMLATTVTASKAAVEAVLGMADKYRTKQPLGAKLAGVHLEGPFISPLWPGAQNPAYIVPPHMDWLEHWCANWPDLIRMLTLAPETEGALEMIAWLADKGIVAACGHTDATYEVMTSAAKSGLSHAVHTYNAMRGLHHREPGTVGAVLTLDAVSAEIIADGHHVHPAAIRLLTRFKPADKLLLITDAIAAAGLGDADYVLGGLPVTVTGGVARLTEGGSLAGSTLTMIDAFRYMLTHSGLSAVEISRLGSGNPARLLGIDKLTGNIAPGKQADLIWTDEDFNIRCTWVDGLPVSMG